MQQNRNEISAPTRAGPAFLRVVDRDGDGFTGPLDAAPASLGQAVTQALGAGFGLALRDAEAALHVARLFTMERANEQAVSRAIATARKALDEMEAALP